MREPPSGTGVVLEITSARPLRRAYYGAVAAQRAAQGLRRGIPCFACISSGPAPEDARVLALTRMLRELAETPVVPPAARGVGCAAREWSMHRHNAADVGDRNPYAGGPCPLRVLANPRPTASPWRGRNAQA